MFLNSRLIENDDCCRVQFPRVDSAPCGHTEPQRDIRHTVDNDTLMLWRIFGNLTEMSLDYVITVQERHFAIGLDPNLLDNTWHQKAVLVRPWV